MPHGLPVRADRGDVRCASTPVSRSSASARVGEACADRDVERAVVVERNRGVRAREREQAFARIASGYGVVRSRR